MVESSMIARWYAERTMTLGDIRSTYLFAPLLSATEQYPPITTAVTESEQGTM